MSHRVGLGTTRLLRPKWRCPSADSFHAGRMMKSRKTPWHRFVLDLLVLAAVVPIYILVKHRMFGTGPVAFAVLDVAGLSFLVGLIGSLLRLNKGLKMGPTSTILLDPSQTAPSSPPAGSVSASSEMPASAPGLRPAGCTSTATNAELPLSAPHSNMWPAQRQIASLSRTWVVPSYLVLILAITSVVATASASFLLLRGHGVAAAAGSRTAPGVSTTVGGTPEASCLSAAHELSILAGKEASIYNDVWHYIGAHPTLIGTADGFDIGASEMLALQTQVARVDVPDQLSFAQSTLVSGLEKGQAGYDDEAAYYSGQGVTLVQESATYTQQSRALIRRARSALRSPDC